jgi:aspartyl-tRNA(Asn)/glutamyl-tRNA(Gln) amidotransferase subunit B
LRSKEEAQDYRYFPDPDLLPVYIDEALLDKIKKTLPELPHEKHERFMQDYQLSAYDANILIMQPLLSNYFENTVAAANGNAKLCANWIISELLGALNKNNLSIENSPVSPEGLGQLVQRIVDDTISSKIAKDVFIKMWETGRLPDKIIEDEGLKQVTDSSFIEKIVDEVIAAHPEQLADYVSGKDKLFGFFVGQCMKASQGKINPAQLNALLKEKLK